MLRCIRCGACMNHCPVYHAIGGHAYGWVYPGPMGAVLTPSLIGIDEAGNLPNASTFCGRCEEVCPVRIPLPRMMRSWREREFERHLSPATVRCRPRLLGVLRQASAALRLRDLDRGAAPRTGRAPRAAASPCCRSRPAGPAIAISRRRRERPSSRGGRIATTVRRRAAPIASHDLATMTARDLIFATIRRSLGVTGTEAPRRAAVAARLAGHPRGVVPARGELPPQRAGRSVRPHGGGGVRHDDAGRLPRRTSRRRSPTSCAGSTCRCGCGTATIPGSPLCPGGTRRRSRFLAAPPTAMISRRSRMPSPRSRRPARWCSRRGRTIRRRSTSCPTCTSSWSRPAPSPPISRR